MRIRSHLIAFPLLLIAARSAIAQDAAIWVGATSGATEDDAHTYNLNSNWTAGLSPSGQFTAIPGTGIVPASEVVQVAVVDPAEV